MSEVGKLNRLEVVRLSPHGAYLDAGELGELLLPEKNHAVGDLLEVFIYLDSSDRLVCTTSLPRVQVGEFALLKVASVTQVGAFLDWGLPKELLVPFREQHKTMEEGRNYLVYVYLDEQSGRIVASSRLDRFVDRHAPNYQEGEAVELLIAGPTELGYKAIINGRHWGLIFANQVFQPIKSGQRLPGYIARLREDGKIDLSLQKPGYGKIEGVAGEILEKLRSAGGYLPVTDRSTPEVIYRKFGISKKNFKKAVGSLYKQRLIVIEPAGIRLSE